MLDVGMRGGGGTVGDSKFELLISISGCGTSPSGGGERVSRGYSAYDCG